MGAASGGALARQATWPVTTCCACRRILNCLIPATLHWASSTRWVYSHCPLPSVACSSDQLTVLLPPACCYHLRPCGGDTILNAVLNNLVVLQHGGLPQIYTNHPAIFCLYITVFLVGMARCHRRMRPDNAFSRHVLDSFVVIYLSVGYSTC